MKKKTKYTPHQAASETRKQIIRKIRRMQGNPNPVAFYYGEPTVNARELIEWIQLQDERAAKRKGGL